MFLLLFELFQCGAPWFTLCDNKSLSGNSSVGKQRNMVYPAGDISPQGEAPPVQEGQEPLVWANGQFVTCDQGA
jgi:hypothetical protein